jgi:hypothetical protein
MKKRIVVILTLLALLFAFLPSQVALAEKATENTTLNIRNRTGFPLTLTLIDIETGARQVFTFAPGTTQTLTLAGKYRYYAQTACGIRQGGFQLFGARELHFACGLGLAFNFSNPNGWYTPPVFEPLPAPVSEIVPVVDTPTDSGCVSDSDCGAGAMCVGGSCQLMDPNPGGGIGPNGCYGGPCDN